MTATQTSTLERLEAAEAEVRELRRLVDELVARADALLERKDGDR